MRRQIWKAAFLAVALALAGCGGDGNGTSGGNTSGGDTCSASNCAGCCFNGQCQSGNTASACGKNGAACSACGNAQICKTDQTCGVDPDSMWKVQPVSASISTDYDWDALGTKPDPKVELWCPSTSTTPTVTPTVDDDYMPTWSTGGCTATARELLTNGFAIEFFDEDETTDDIIAPKGTLTVTEAQLLAGGNTITNNTTLLKATIHFTRQ